MPTTPRKPAKAGSQAIVRTSGTIGTPATSGMLATAGTLYTADMQATLTDASNKSEANAAAEISETVLTPIPREFQKRRKFAKKIK
jgi:hypothetical protein